MKLSSDFTSNITKNAQQLKGIRARQTSNVNNPATKQSVNLPSRRLLYISITKDRLALLHLFTLAQTLMNHEIDIYFPFRNKQC